MPGPFDRDRLLSRARDASGPWDILVVGGGATGVGIALDAASRGYHTLLLEQSDFGKGTSSRSTKLVHGGVRYLRQGNIALVRSALRERGILRDNASHLVHSLAFLVPTYSWWERTYYGLGLRMYDLLAGKWNLQRSQRVSADNARQVIPALNTDRLRGGVIYYDGLFDDARLLINLVQTSIEQGATCINYARVVEPLKQQGRVVGVIAEDLESGVELRAEARVVINATGPFVDALRQKDNPEAQAMIAPSQGIHLVVDASFLGGQTALMVPKTSDGRVMFAIPWHGHTLIGTTDTPVDRVELEPRPFREEIDFLLETAGRYLTRRPERTDVRSTFSGIRPLVREEGRGSTSRLARDHTMVVSDSQMITITGGKWTTYREMAEACVDLAASVAGLAAQPCRTATLRIHGAAEFGCDRGSHWYYGSDAAALSELLKGDYPLQQRLHSRLPYLAGEVIWSARHELARTVEDVLARRTRGLFLDVMAAVESAPVVAQLLARELGRDNDWEKSQVDQFRELSEAYLPGGAR